MTTSEQEGRTESSARIHLTGLRSRDIVFLPVGGDPAQLSLPLRRYRPQPGRPTRGAVLLIHGASASSDTFLIPNGGLVYYLKDRGWDVWTLDWRGSLEVINTLPKAFINGSLAEECKLFTVDCVAEEDFPKALEHIQKTLREEAGQEGDAHRSPRGTPRVSVVAHCFGSGAFSVALSRGRARDVTNVVLSTLGLFYEAPWDGWVKAEDFLIEQILGQEPKHRAIDPGKLCEWPETMRKTYKAWPRSWLPKGDTDADEVFRRLSYMFGQPYLRDHLADGIHGPLLRTLFGGMHLGLYLHAGQMVRRGYAARLDVLDVIDRSRLDAGPSRVPVTGDLNPQHFIGKRITLITGAQNHLWHRDSIDLMYEFLLSHHVKETTKLVLEDYGHQDLLWGKCSKRDVYEFIATRI